MKRGPDISEEDYQDIKRMWQCPDNDGNVMRVCSTKHGGLMFIIIDNETLKSHRFAFNRKAWEHFMQWQITETGYTQGRDK